MFIKRVSFILLLFLLFSCHGHKQSFANSLLSTKNIPEILHGWWLSEGYGNLIYIGDNQSRFFQVSENFCLEEELDGEEIHDFYTYYQSTKSHQNIEFFGSYDPYPYRYQKLQNQLGICNQSIIDTPLNNFEVFADLFKTHYAFFDLYNVDWPSRITTYRQKINDETTNQQLFEIFSTMLKGFNDGHIHIKAEIDGAIKRFDAYPGKITNALEKLANDRKISLDEASNLFHNHYWLTEITKEILGEKGQFFGNKRGQYGMIDQPAGKTPIGYLSLVSVGSSLANEDEFNSIADAIDAYLDQAINLFKENQAQAVIIDLTINYGGYDFISRKIAERFAAKTTPSYSKYPADAPKATAYKYQLTPHSKNNFTGPVYVMTSNITLSGGELLTMSLKSLPNVTHVGETTRGALSDKLEKTLPNGWEISLSNEVYLDHQGREFEGKGIPPDISIPVFDWNNLMNGHIEAINKLIKIVHGDLIKN